MLTDTELRLSFWRDGSTQAERLAAAVLRLAGYEQTDPQSPLGGPDGKADIICVKGGLEWVAAVYFPSSQVSFASVRKKFKADILGVDGLRRGFVFITNQNLTPTQRSTLRSLGSARNMETDILHCQQIQNVLDSPSGYGVRIQFLKIPMSIEEQLSWAVDADTQTAKELAATTRELRALRAAVDSINVGQKHIIRTLAQAVPQTIPTPDLISMSAFAKSDAYPMVTEAMAPQMVLLFHRLTCFDLPLRVVGQFRTDNVWLGNAQGERAKHIVPVRPSEIKGRLEALCSEWRRRISTLTTADEKLLSIAEFHANFLALHPFLDGNGRTARAILMQQCLDLFGKADLTLMNKGAEYYGALKSADQGNFDSLVGLLRPVIEN